MDFARQKKVETTPEEITNVFRNSGKLKDHIRWLMNVTKNGFNFSDPMDL